MENTASQPSSQHRLLRINDVADLTTLSKSCINLWVATDRFPKPIPLSTTLKVWKFGDVIDWIEARSKQVGGAK